MDKLMQAQRTDEIPPLYSVFDLKSGARAKLVDRSGSMVIIEVGKQRSDWIEWGEVEPRVTKGTEIRRANFGLHDQAIFYSEMK